MTYFIGLSKGNYDSIFYLFIYVPFTSGITVDKFFFFILVLLNYSKFIIFNFNEQDC